MKREDIEFLKELQGRMKNEHEYLTGPTFWSIGERVRRAEPRLFAAEGSIIYGRNEECEFEDVQELYESLKEFFEDYPGAKISLEEDEIKFAVEEKYGTNEFSICFDDWIENIEYGVGEINKLIGSSEYDCYEYEYVNRYRANLLFFTKEGAERCLEANKQYLQEPFIFQTATPNPELRELWKIIKETDWSKLEAENV